MTVRIALDAALRIPSCAVSVNGELWSTTTAEGPVEGFVTVIRQALEEASIQLTQVDEIVACVGPGSYMGVRTTVSTANALALAIDCPVTGVLSVDALAFAAPTHVATTVAVPAGRGRWFVAAYTWTREVLQRDGLPQLLDDAGPNAWRAREADDDPVDRVRLDARCTLLVAEQQRHLATETCLPQIAPHLPPVRIGGQQ